MRDRLARITAAIERAWDDQLAWLTTLVGFPSLRGEEAACQAWLAREFSGRGWAVDRYTLAEIDMAHLPGFSPVVDTDYATAVQLVATLPAADPSARSLILQGHVDVVPTGPAEMWGAPPFVPRQDAGRLFGRGAGDMKAGVSAMVFALDALAAAGFAPAGQVLVQTVTEEESTGNGALSTLARGYRADACLIPEPSGLGIGRATLGVMWFRLRLRGVPAHVGRSEQGTNAILSAYGVIAALQEHTAELNRRIAGHPWFGRLQNPIKFNPGRISGGDWASSTAAWCDVDCRIAVLPGQSLEAFRDELRQIVAQAAQRDPFLAANPPELIWNGFQAEDYVQEPGSAFEDVLRAAHRQVTGEEAAEVILPAVADTRFYGRYYGIPSLTYGPRAERIHGVDEAVDLDSLKQATVAIALTVADWTGMTAAV